MANIIAPCRVCPQCGAAFKAHHGKQQFCQPAHQGAFHDINAKRGKVLLPLIASWRSGKRGVSADSSYAFAEMARLADRWAAEDKAVGRDPSLIVAAKRKAGWSAADLG